MPPLAALSPLNPWRCALRAPTPTAVETQALRAELLSAEAARDPAFVAAWTDLAGDLVEENPFYEPYALAPALAAYGGGKVRLACVWRGERLIGLTPLEARRFYARLPVVWWASWVWPHCYFAAPLVRRGHESAFFSELFALLGEGADARAFLRLCRIDRDGALAAAAARTAAKERRICYEAGAASRAMLCGGASAEATLAAHVRKKKRKEIARLRSRLEELGRVEAKKITPTDDLGAWTESFLALEDKSWKGARKTSKKASEADAAWFRAALAGAQAAGKLDFLRLDLAGRPIAMLVNFLSNGAGYSLKICHDPEFARFSPGVMIELEAMRAFLNDPSFRFADSCAAPDHTMINGLWRTRRTLAGMNVSGKGAGARASLGLARLVEGTRAKIPLRAGV